MERKGIQLIVAPPPTSLGSQWGGRGMGPCSPCLHLWPNWQTTADMRNMGEYELNAFGGTLEGPHCLNLGARGEIHGGSIGFRKAKGL